MDFYSILEKFVDEVSGKDAVKLLNLMKELENISEYDFAEDLKINVNQVRNLLYKLNSFNLVYSTRKKDREKGLYIYYWTFNFKHSRDLLITRKTNELNNLQDELKKENDQRFYVCKNGCMRVELEEAMELEFKCNECGSLFQQEDSTKKIGEINHKISILNQELEELKKPLTFAVKAKEIKVKRTRSKKKKLKKYKKKNVKKKPEKKIKKTNKKKPKKNSGILNKLRKIRF